MGENENYGAGAAFVAAVHGRRGTVSTTRPNTLPATNSQNSVVVDLEVSLVRTGAPSAAPASLPIAEDADAVRGFRRRSRLRVPDQTFRPVATSIPLVFFWLPFTCPVDSQWANYNRFSGRVNRFVMSTHAGKVMNIVPEEALREVLLLFGTPAVRRAVRKYLAKFLMDKRIAPMNRAGWWFVLHLFILPKLGRASAEKYQKIWTDEGSPFHHRPSEAGGRAWKLRLRMRLDVCGALRHELQRPVVPDCARAGGRGLHASHRASAVPAKRLLDHRLGVR